MHFKLKYSILVKRRITHSPPGQPAELLSTLVVRALLQELQDVHGSVEVATGQADADRCFMFVPCQHPHFDPCQP